MRPIHKKVTVRNNPRVNKAPLEDELALKFMKSGIPVESKASIMFAESVGRSPRVKDDLKAAGRVAMKLLSKVAAGTRSLLSENKPADQAP